MKRILAIDYGLKRCGLAVTDLMQIIASPFDTVNTDSILSFLNNYFINEPVETIVLGYPTMLDGNNTDLTNEVISFKKILEKKFEHINVIFVDERLTSKMAKEALIQGGFSKKHRKTKENIDKLSAVFILQSYLEQKNKI